MSDRMSTYWIFNRPVVDMNRAQAMLNRTQEQISTGKQLLSPSDDPVGATRMLQLDQEIGLMEQYQDNISMARSRLQQEEGILQGVNSSIQRIRELAVQAGNAGTLTEVDRRAIGIEVRERVSELLDLFNTQDGSGEYLFSGFAGHTKPFETGAGGGFIYQGDEGQRNIQISRTNYVASSDTGKEAFMDIESNNISFFTNGSANNRSNPPAVISAGITIDQEALDAFYPHDAVITFENPLDVSPAEPNFTVRRKDDGRVVEGLQNITYRPGATIQFGGMNVSVVGNPEPGDKFIVESSEKQSILTTFQKFEFALNEISTDPAMSDTYDQFIEDTLANLDFAIDNISEVRARIGSRMNTADSTEEMHMDNALAAKGIRAEIRDLDFAEAVSRMEMESFILQASQQSFAKVTQLSLFNYIS